MQRFCHIFREAFGHLQQARKTALTDSISGLPNHRAGEAFLERMIAAHRNQGVRFAVLFIDGDNLKAYNNIDYEAGNKMIRKLAALISACIRDSDYICRWFSGDEFLVILPRTTSEKARKVAERIRSTVESATLSWTVPMTISVGIALCPEDGTNASELARKAARANTVAKTLGKNRVAFGPRLSVTEIRPALLSKASLCEHMTGKGAGHPSLQDPSDPPKALRNPRGDQRP